MTVRSWVRILLDLKMHDIKNYYQTAKIKKTTKSSKLFFLAVAPTYGSYDQKLLAATQQSLEIYKVKNTNLRRTLNHSVFKKYTNLVYGTLVLVSPKRNCANTRFAELLSNRNKRLGLVVMCVFINKKIYPISFLHELKDLNHSIIASNLVTRNLNLIKKSFSKLVYSAH